MSLIPTANAGSASQDYSVLNVGTSTGPMVDAVGVLRIAPDGLGASYVQGVASSIGPGSLTLGANATNFNHVVLSSGPALTTITTNAACNGGLTVAGASTFTSSIDVNFQQIQNNLRYTQAFGPVADSTNDVPLGSAQPPLIFGSYAITVQVTGNPQIQPSCIGYWNGTQWSAGANGVAHTFPGGNVSVGIRPAPDGASLVMSNGSGAPISGFVYYTSLGEN